ncbi:uncharacterized protein LOC122245783 [Penaeus japonicus]|uniref:uncharacterized protein LOC122245783 n=1 Tax=Penaeus japonicus TaxID=27405 RepID=UPI001C70CAF4|nr:uncharacterized protein LOC122245783 [Penaeus japonicus]
MQWDSKTKVVLVAIVFCLYWTGFLSFVVQFLFSSLVSTVAFVTGEEYLESTGDVLGNAEKALNRDQRQVSGKLEEMISNMERMVEETDLAEMNDEEMVMTFGKLYELIPVMDSLFERILKTEMVQAVNPRGDFYEMQRRYDALRTTLEQKRKEKEEL